MTCLNDFQFIFQHFFGFSRNCKNCKSLEISRFGAPALAGLFRAELRPSIRFNRTIYPVRHDIVTITVTHPRHVIVTISWRWQRWGYALSACRPRAPTFRRSHIVQLLLHMGRQLQGIDCSTDCGTDCSTTAAPTSAAACSTLALNICLRRADCT